MKLGRGLLAGVLVMAAGCYTYAPIEMNQVTPEMEVRARLTPPQAESLGEAVPIEDRLLQGEVLEADQAGLTLLVPVVSAIQRGRAESLGQRLRLPTDGIIELELRKLDRTRTSVLTIAGAVITGFVLYKSLQGGGGGAPPGPGGSTSDALIPIRIPVGW